MTIKNDNKETAEACTPEKFCLSQQPCTLQQFDSLETNNKLEAFHNIINVRVVSVRAREM